MTDRPIPPTDPSDEDAPTVFVTAGGPAARPWSNGLPTDLPARLGRYELLSFWAKAAWGRSISCA